MKWLRRLARELHRRSVWQVGGVSCRRPQPIPEIVRELGVDAVLAKRSDRAAAALPPLPGFEAPWLDRTR